MQPGEHSQREEIVERTFVAGRPSKRPEQNEAELAASAKVNGILHWLCVWLSKSLASPPVV